MEVEHGFFCRPNNCPTGETWADGLAYGDLYQGGGMCAKKSCVNKRHGYTRLDARPNIRCFPDMHEDYVENIALPTACYMQSNPIQR